MSVFIDGLEMPKTNMMLLVEPDGKVWEMGDLLGNDKLLDGVKAIPAPPHGRLIDAGKIYDAVEQRYRISSGIEHRCERDLLDLICAAPTIIEAEEGE